MRRVILNIAHTPATKYTLTASGYPQLLRRVFPANACLLLHGSAKIRVNFYSQALNFVKTTLSQFIYCSTKILMCKCFLKCCSGGF